MHPCMDLSFSNLDRYCKRKMTRSVVNVGLTFGETAKLFSKWLYHFTFPPVVYVEFSFLCTGYNQSF